MGAAALAFRHLHRLRPKPSFQPPDAVIPLAWRVINSALAAGAYRLLRQPDTPQRNGALGWWALNVAPIGGWNGIFFGRRNLPASTLLAATMVGTGAACVVQARRVDPPAAGSGVAWVAWVAFVMVLTAALWRRNRLQRGLQDLRTFVQAGVACGDTYKACGSALERDVSSPTSGNT